LSTKIRAKLLPAGKNPSKTTELSDHFLPVGISVTGFPICQRPESREWVVGAVREPPPLSCWGNHATDL
jgi:hypothetical protein